MAITIYHNPRCLKSRCGLEYLKGKGIEFEVRDYLKEPLTRQEMERLLIKLHIAADQLVRTQEDYFKRELKGRNFNSDEWVSILNENPKLIQRPIVEGKHKAVVANPPEEMDRIQELKKP